MELFNDVCKSYLNESVIDIPMDDLDPTVFRTFDDNRPPILMPGIKNQILKDIDSINALITVNDFFMTGDLLTKKYNSKSEIEIMVEIDPSELDNISHSNIVRLLNKINKRYATGTTHTINYTIVTHEIDEINIENMYDIVNERWIKTGPALDSVLSPIYTKLLSSIESLDIATGKLKKNLINMNDVKELPEKYKKRFIYILKYKVKQMDRGIKDLLKTYKNINPKQYEMFIKKTTSLEDLHRIKANKNLPENVVYKLFEKYYYIKFLQKLVSLIEVKGPETKNVEYVKILQQILNTLYKLRKE